MKATHKMQARDRRAIFTWIGRITNDSGNPELQEGSTFEATLIKSLPSFLTTHDAGRISNDQALGLREGSSGGDNSRTPSDTLI